MSKAKDNWSADKLAEKMQTPPFDPTVEPEVKPGSYEKFVEVADDLRADADEEIAKQQERGSSLWESVGKKNADL